MDFSLFAGSLSLSLYCDLAGKLEGGGGSGQSNLSADFPFRDILPQNTSLPFAQNTMSSLLTKFYFYLLTLDKILLLPSHKILFLSSHTIPFLASHKILFLRSLICALFCQINSMMTEVLQGVCSYFDPWVSSFDFILVFKLPQQLYTPTLSGPCRFIILGQARKPRSYASRNYDPPTHWLTDEGEV